MDMYDVTRLGRRIGGVSVAAEGLTTVVDAVCDMPDDKIYRLAAVCGADKRYVPLGVALPDGGKLRFYRKYTKNALREIGFAEPSGFLLVLRDEREEMENGKWRMEDEREVLNVAAEPELVVEVAAGPAEIVEIAEPAAAPELFSRAASEIIIGGSEWRGVGDPQFLFRDGEPRAITEPIRGALAREEDGVTLLAVPIEESRPFEMMPVFCFGEPAEIEGREYLVFKIKDGVLTV